ncbi:MAG TPA: hypothetical protein PKG60_11855 [Spirochaetota bacterium]|nr:hypothetical protein [Spirochaetota bacterium]
MEKLIIRFIIFSVILAAGCSSVPELKKSDINQLTDKKFYLSDVKAVVVEHYLASKREVVFDPSLPKEIVSKIPIGPIVKVLSDEFKIEGDFSEFKSKALETDGSWISGKKNVNTISIMYEFHPYVSDDGVKFFSYHYCSIRTASGASKYFRVKSHEEVTHSQEAFDPRKVANKQGIKVEDALKMMLIEDIKNMPYTLATALKNSRE